jgi:hypothetical protein
MSQHQEWLLIRPHNPTKAAAFHQTVSQSQVR